jgi:hypothetical protein
VSQPPSISLHPKQKENEHTNIEFTCAHPVDAIPEEPKNFLASDMQFTATVRVPEEVEQ